MSALLLTQGMSSSKHAGVRDLFNKHFIRDGVFPREMERFFNRLFALRQKSDYEDLFRLMEEEVKPLLVESRNFLYIIQDHVGNLLEEREG